jgi:hypothetical protein
MKLKDKVRRYYSILEEEIWGRVDNNIVFKLLCWLFCIPYRISFKIKRCICWLFGCKERGGYGGFNLPEEAYSYWCDRCGVGESNYEGDSSYEMLEGKIKRRRYR